ncbi:MAG: hypothetical protein RDU59_04245 [Thermodesulfobacteriota bacterium]|nr:hypothetical protein [Deltaproteobacteria bacterium]MDP3028619.1 hypothetical protein [Deltaproteobacteria bacterium]MDQ7837688.1 hypothetical protein [Thermodesulfobacteriota bacterium]
MANLQIKGVKEDLYEEIKRLAAAENRSVGQEMLFLVKEYLSRKGRIGNLKTPAQVLLELAGSWEDDKTAEEIVAEIRSARKNSRKLSEGF